MRGYIGIYIYIWFYLEVLGDLGSGGGMDTTIEGLGLVSGGLSQYAYNPCRSCNIPSSPHH